MSRFRKPIALLVRLVAGLALLAFLVRAIGPDDLRAAFIPVREQPGWIAVSSALAFFALLVGAIRWHSILRTLGLSNPMGDTIRGYFIGQFFNAFLFGACGGDLARAVFAAHHHPEKRPEAITSVFLDRGIGLVLTLLFGCALLLPRLAEFTRHPDSRPALVLMAVFLAATVALLALLFGRNLFERSLWLQRLEQRSRIGPMLHRAYDALYLFRRNARHLIGPAALSLVNLLLLAAATAALARALGLALLFRDLLVVFPIITVLAAVPLTPGSLGIRETLYIQLLQPLGIAAGPALLLSLLGYLVGTLWSLLGGALFLLRAPDQRS